jgi:hypothetical protein
MLQGADDESKKIRAFGAKEDDRSKTMTKPMGKMQNAEGGQRGD